MKKIKALIIAIVLSLMTCISAFTVSAQIRKISDGYILLEDYGMLGNGFYKVYLTPNERIACCDCSYSKFCFITNDGVSDEDVLEVIFKYYPDNNLNSSNPEGNGRSADIRSWTYENETYYSVSDSTDDEDISDIENSIMLELNEKNLISAFYKSGEHGQVTEYFEFNPPAYSYNDYETIENYMSENNIDFTSEESSLYDKSFEPILDNNTTAKEYFELAVGIYRQTGLIPNLGPHDDFYNYSLYGKNALEDITPSETTATTTTTPTETTTTTISTTVTSLVSAEKSLADYKLLEDNGMFEIIGHDTYRMYLTPFNWIEIFKYYNDTFAFVLNNNASDDEVLEVISKYYPDNDLNPSYQKGDEVSASISVHTYENKTYYTIYDETDNEDISDITNNMMLELNDKNLISAFYDSEEVGLLQHVTGFEQITYYTEYKEAIEQYINEKSLNLTLEFAPANEICPVDGYILVSENERTVEENFKIAADIYKELDIRPDYCVVDVIERIYGKNALEDITPAETTTTTTTPTETTATTISTTITTQPTEPSKPIGDADGDNEVTVRDCAFIAAALAQGRSDEFTENADFNDDGKVNVRDAAAIAKSLAESK